MISFLKKFFGEDVKVSGKDNEKICFKRFKSENEIIVVTNDVKKIGEHYAMLVDNDKIICLKDNQIVRLRNSTFDLNSYAVKIKRDEWNVMVLPYEFEDMAFTEEVTFDLLIKVAKEQDGWNMEWELGHYDMNLN